MPENSQTSRTRPLRAVIITQDDPFFLGDSFKYLFSKLSDNINVTSCVLLSVSPFGKKESFFKKLQKTYNVFGFWFCLHYGAHFVISKFRINWTVAAVMRRNGVEILRLSRSINHPDSLEAIRSRSPDVLVSIAGNEIFKQPLLDIAPYGCINLHSALLPKYRGLMPSFWVLRHEEEETGVSVFFVNEGIDTGPILVQKRFKIGEMSQRDLIRYSKIIGMDAICEALEKIHAGETETLPNDDGEATYFSFPTRKDVDQFRRSGARFF
ncbi:methionyl-tRNA formyltransferase [Glycocaulis abyssi]|uniref:Methionyl-tRNA formyltransferase n=1 Tax=Glycocaulis abyssi TaxID=1433403 RepID=A0ABV9NGP9_9PROT